MKPMHVASFFGIILIVLSLLSAFVEGRYLPIPLAICGSSLFIGGAILDSSKTNEPS